MQLQTGYQKNYPWKVFKGSAKWCGKDRLNQRSVSFNQLICLRLAKQELAPYTILKAGTGC